MPSESFVQGRDSCPRTSHSSLKLSTLATCLLFRQPYNQKMVGMETGAERTDGRWANIFLPGHSFKKHRSDAVTCLLKNSPLFFPWDERSPTKCLI